MRTINKIIIHCSATKGTSKQTFEDVKKWHVEGNKWSDVGYHYGIERDGRLEQGRPIDKVGAHTKGHNSESIGICLMGGIDDNGKAENNFTPEQFATLKSLIETIFDDLGKLEIYGHYNFAAKACPCFAVADWVSNNGLY